MVSPARIDKLRAALDRLSEDEQDRVIRFADELSTNKAPEGTPLKDLMPFFGCISEETADQMEKDIEEAFERIDPNEWKDPA